MKIEEEVSIQNKIEGLESLNFDQNLIQYLLNENKQMQKKINELINNQKYFNAKISEFGNLERKMERNLDNKVNELNVILFKQIKQQIHIQTPQPIKPQVSLIKKLTDADKRVVIGKTLIDNMSAKFLKKNQGKFVAITLHGVILNIQDTLQELNEKLGKLELKENFYIEKIGSDVMTTI